MENSTHDIDIARREALNKVLRDANADAATVALIWETHDRIHKHDLEIHRLNEETEKSKRKYAKLMEELRSLEKEQHMLEEQEKSIAKWLSEAASGSKAHELLEHRLSKVTNDLKENSHKIEGKRETIQRNIETREEWKRQKQRAAEALKVATVTIAHALKVATVTTGKILGYLGCMILYVIIHI